ncbi:PadR family transcriptional regulator [Nocardiopsis changdeensis]|uniref:PadR family transcriptional regulator n=1 Tax=Nocardiopsis changdeensis TaxID=2831969 RepID=A0ABX8BMJ6_9ACTN|nr:MULTISPECIES: PadR family transcriptional regulator [Nocardiopsis]QUX23464.1 PadR family transcriptional regulator [Nocardiopsis changdeensis]QYX39408.1 PadR family transcriptional regulator [Nocardiopsis sp. MT53]
MSATRLLVLGVVRISGRAHGYRVGRELMDWGASEWANVKWGSIYHALRKLTAEGRLREVEAEGDDVVERVSYEITGEGEAEFHRLLRKALSHAGDDHALLCAGVTLMTALPRAEVVELLRSRIADLEKSSAQALEIGRLSTEEWNKPEHVRPLFTLWELTVGAAVEWTRRLIRELEEGRYTMADDGPQAFGLPPAGAPRG